MRVALATAFALNVGCVLGAAPGLKAAEVMDIALAGTEVFRTDDPVNIVAVGDPAIADVSLINPRAVLITGKRVGTTGFILLDQAGTEITRRVLRIGGEQKGVRVIDGSRSSRTFVCAPLCTPAAPRERVRARQGTEPEGEGGGEAASPPTAQSPAPAQP